MTSTTDTTRAPVADEVAQDLILTATRAVIALDRRDFGTILDAAKRLEEHGMSLARFATRRITGSPVGVTTTDTRTGAPYLHFQAWLCPTEQGGCGMLATDVEDDDGAPLPLDDDWREDNPDSPEPEYRCPNCRHAPLARVGVTTADYRAS